MDQSGEPSDAALLREFVRNGSDAAFRRVVDRHLGMVHAAARRQLRNAQAADDVAQAVFILLAQKAGSIARPALLAGWLVKATHFACRDANKREARRKIHEGRAAAMNAAKRTQLRKRRWIPLRMRTTSGPCSAPWMRRWRGCANPTGRPCRSDSSNRLA